MRDGWAQAFAETARAYWTPQQTQRVLGDRGGQGVAGEGRGDRDVVAALAEPLGEEGGELVGDEDLHGVHLSRAGMTRRRAAR